jgi:uncharacterized protein (TIGR00730 family)
MDEHHKGPVKAYRDERFINSPNARSLRILAEYLEPEARFEELDVSDTIVFFGSARMKSRDEAIRQLEAARNHGGDIACAELDLENSRYYEDARTLAHRLTKWSKDLEGEKRRFLVCTGGGPGIMEAANRGSSEAGGVNIGLNISLPFEQHDNPFITRELSFEFHYFFMRKFWFMYLAKAMIVFPGGFGTMDEFFETLTLIQTKKINKVMPIVLYGKSFWRDTLNLDALVRHGTISPGDIDLFREADSVDEAFDYIVEGLCEHALCRPGGCL